MSHIIESMQNDLMELKEERLSKRILIAMSSIACHLDHSSSNVYSEDMKTCMKFILEKLQDSNVTEEVRKRIWYRIQNDQRFPEWLKSSTQPVDKMIEILQTKFGNVSIDATSRDKWELEWKYCF